MKAADFDFDLPEKFIAQDPVVPRDHSKLMAVVGGQCEHRQFFELAEYLREGDVLVVNRSRVIPARILFEVDGRKMEIFVLKKVEECVYKVLVKPGKKFKVGADFSCGDFDVEVIEVCEDGARIVRFSDDEVMKRNGSTPLPPYITESQSAADQYQTVYSKEEGSVAAPTAGLHFTDELLAKLKDMGVEIVEVVLHVGRGTFLPVSAEDLEEHQMHSEFYEISEEACGKLNAAKAEGRRIIAVGTTSVRVLESNIADGRFKPFAGETDIFIYPGSYVWKACDGLITNFHLPKSTLIMLVASFLESKGVDDGRLRVLELYESAKERGYRFYSFGDAMFIA